MGYNESLRQNEIGGSAERTRTVKDGRGGAVEECAEVSFAIRGVVRGGDYV